MEGTTMTTFDQEDTWDNSYSIMCIGDPPTWRLVHNPSLHDPSEQNSMRDNTEEVMLSIQGIVLRRSELPPFMDKLG
jgi:hypothetical protein